MSLTPEDVRNKRFTPVRLREGYDMGEVDQFLDEVEAELERLTVENEELRAKVAAASSGETTGLISAPGQRSAHESAQEPGQETATESVADQVQQPAQGDQSSSAPPSDGQYQPGSSADSTQEMSDVGPVPGPPESDQEIEPASADQLGGSDESLEDAKKASRAGSIGEASAAAARLLEIASNNADELMEQAKEEADRVLGEANTKADRILSEARGKADRVETDSRIRAQKLDDETNERREQALGAIERERTELQRDVEHLRAYEREYRARLKNYFQTQLEGLEAGDQSYDDSELDSPAPRRIRTDDEI